MHSRQRTADNTTGNNTQSNDENTRNEVEKYSECAPGTGTKPDGVRARREHHGKHRSR